jgi:GNAT superfamily N-acetyltransferase
MVIIKRTNADHPDFRSLVDLLTGYLAVLDGDQHAFYNQYNKLDAMRHVVVVYINEIPVGCGAIRQFDENTTEVKRMFVMPEYRGKGIAATILKELEDWAKELGFTYCILETGIKMKDAIRLYQRNAYTPIENYGPYAGLDNSVCMKKHIL